MATLLDKLFSFNQYQALIAGLAMMLTAIANPDGITKDMQVGFNRLTTRLGGLLTRREVAGPVVATGPRAEDPEKVS
jgi:hypothetical protein